MSRERWPRDSLKHQIGVKLMMQMKYYLEGFEKQHGHIPTFDDVFNKSVQIASEVEMFKDVYRKMFNVYIEERSKGANITVLFEAILDTIFADIKIQLICNNDIKIGYFTGKNQDYKIQIPYSWFTLLHEFIHIYLRELDFPDDERLAYVIPAGIFYFYRFYQKEQRQQWQQRQSTLDEFM